ncbi:creatininase family protein [Nocardia sp. NPDC004068]|uniref:creatininase family protein n=1 Tax=Nocardia sp. NPDC004068 TaxID=3364303 RepID=UPI00368D0778
MIDRFFGRLTSPQISSELGRDSVLCLPVGSYEQHGPHLPLHTDAVIAEQFAVHLVERYGDDFDLWLLPTLPYGLSLEHAWAPGTFSLTAVTFTSILKAIVSESVRTTGSRNLLLVNGHGGNRGILEAVLYELRRECGVHACVIHPSSLASTKIDTTLPEIHAGLRETSVMLALSPDDVHLENIPKSFSESDLNRSEIREFILDRGVTWPWTSADSGISALGIMGSDPRDANADIGWATINSALDACPEVLERLLNQQVYKLTQG